MSEFVLDAFNFCKNGERREGERAVAGFPRLAEESVGQAGMLHWVLQGGRDQRGNMRMDLSIRGMVPLLCQRCLSPLDHVIDSSSVLILAQDDGSADELEAILADEDVEVIVGSTAMNFLELIEDEALLALPLSPRHESCAGGSEPAEEPEASEKASPFAILKKLKH